MQILVLFFSFLFNFNKFEEESLTEYHQYSIIKIF